MSEMALSMGVVLADIVVVRKLLAEIESGKTYQNHAVYTHNLLQLSQYAESIGVILNMPWHCLSCSAKPYKY